MKTGRLKQSVYCCLFIVLAHSSLAQGPTCPANIDFEFGNFTNWQCYTGSVSASGTTNVINVTPSAPIANRHTIIGPSQTGNDQFGNFPIHCPNGSSYSIKLGNSNTGREAERISYTFTVPAGQNEYSIVYQYAVVFQDPAHAQQEQPRFTAKVYDVTSNNYVSCATFSYVATSSLPGFLPAPNYSNVWYKPWTPVTINLSGYAGRTVILEFTTADCTQSAHFGYAYVDVNVGCTSPVGGATYCPGATSVTLNAPYGYQSYTWYNSSLTQVLGTQSNLTISPAPPVNTTYALDIVPFPGFGCRDTVYATVKPAILPTATAGPNVGTCNGGHVSIGDTAIPGYTYSWFPTTGLSSASVSNPVASPTTTTDYILTVTNTATGCSKKDTVTVNVAMPAAPIFNFLNGTAQCFDGNNFQFSNPAPASFTSTWNFGDNTSATQQNATHHYSSPGTYQVTLNTVSPTGCIGTATQPVTVYPMPSGTLSARDLKICEGTPVALTATGGSSYNWYQNGVLLGNTAADHFNALQAGTYTIDVIDSNGCKSAGVNSVVLNAVKKPLVDFSFDSYCINMPVSFSNRTNEYNASPVQYSWDFGNGSTATGPNPASAYAATGSYTVTLTATPQNCPAQTASIQKTISIQKPLPGQTYPIINAVANTPMTLQARNIGTAWEWKPAVFLNNAMTRQPVFTGTAEQLYKINITNASGCITVDTQLVQLFKNIDVYVPKAFTPNGDGLNDRMFPFLVGIKELKLFRIINRWGVIVYESKTDLPGWDGLYKGLPQPVEAYVWEAQATDMDGKTILRKGSFTLIR